MTIKPAESKDIPALRHLWKEAFGDTDAFLDQFFRLAFSPDRCRMVLKNGAPVAALYWFDCSWESKKLAYLYAIATAKSHQGQGLCRALMENTHDHLKSLGYRGAALVPATKELFSLYEKFGYRPFCPMQSVCVEAAGTAAELSPLSWKDYETARRQYLPKDGILQEGATLRFLSTFARFYQGERFLLCGYEEEGKFQPCEFLGDPRELPHIAMALQEEELKIHLPQGSTNTAMYLPLDETNKLPAYLGLNLN